MGETNYQINVSITDNFELDKTLLKKWFLDPQYTENRKWFFDNFSSPEREKIRES